MNAVKEGTQGQNCSACNSTSERWLCDVRHRGIYRRLCTGCVLKLHSSFFCPICLEVYADGFPPENSVKCSNCLSSVHAACIAPELIANYVCLCCVKGFAFLGPVSTRNLQRGEEAKTTVVDLPTAKIIVAAAQIASISMTRAAAAAWVDADRKTRDSALAKKRAREALLLASQRAEIKNSFRLEDEIAKQEAMEKQRTGAPNPNSAKKGVVNGEEDDRLVAFTNSLLTQHKNVQIKLNAERNKTKPNEDPVVTVKILPRLSEDGQMV